MNASHTEVVADWTLQLAAAFASEYSVVLNSRHQTLVEIYRLLYFSRGEHPPIRLFIKKIKEESSAASMLELIELFGDKPLFALSYIAGLPKPPHCI